MAKTKTGSVVSRAAATGGSRRRASSGQGPSRFTLAIVAIVVIGTLSIVLARLNYTSSSSASSVPPTIGTTWYAGYTISVCGTDKGSLTPSTSLQRGGLLSLGSGVVKVAPTSASDSGNNANFDTFQNEFGSNPGVGNFLVTSSSISLGLKTYSNGEACPKGTPDAGQKGDEKIAVWPSYAAFSTGKAPIIVTDPKRARFTANSFMSIVFQPSGAAIPKPSAATVKAVLSGGAGLSTVQAKG